MSKGLWLGGSHSLCAYSVSDRLVFGSGGEIEFFSVTMLDNIKKSILSTRILKPLVVFYVHYITSCFVVSYPKCGRTWVKVMLAKALALHFGDSQEDVISPIKVIKKGRYPGPIIRFLHLGTDVPPNPQEKKDDRQYSRYRDKKVVLLVRDPRDVLVSYYFQRTRRAGEEHELTSFIRHPWWGIDRLIAFMNGWYENIEMYPWLFFCSDTRTCIGILPTS